MTNEENEKYHEAIAIRHMNHARVNIRLAVRAIFNSVTDEEAKNGKSPRLNNLAAGLTIILANIDEELEKVGQKPKHIYLGNSRSANQIRALMNTLSDEKVTKEEKEEISEFLNFLEQEVLNDPNNSLEDTLRRLKNEYEHGLGISPEQVAKRRKRQAVAFVLTIIIIVITYIVTMASKH